MQEIGEDEFNDFNKFKAQVDKTLKAKKIKLSAGDKNTLLNAMSWYDESAEKVVKRVEIKSRNGVISSTVALIEYTCVSK